MAMDELSPDVRALRKVPFFEDLTDQDLSDIARIGERVSFSDGDEIVTRGAPADGLWVLLSGGARVEAGGRVHELGPGAFFGEMALLGATPRTATVTASGDVEAMTIKTIYFGPFLIKHPSVAVTILKGVVERLREVQERLERAESQAAE
jgi:CRP-like cAMP-binding protein